tara:strand:+ start:16 stop:216 length:201 start_codon:yes stop_codon:yes gene_type:complete
MSFIKGRCIGKIAEVHGFLLSPSKWINAKLSLDYLPIIKHLYDGSKPSLTANIHWQCLGKLLKYLP